MRAQAVGSTALIAANHRFHDLPVFVHRLLHASRYAQLKSRDTAKRSASCTSFTASQQKPRLSGVFGDHRQGALCPVRRYCHTLRDRGSRCASLPVDRCDNLSLVQSKGSLGGAQGLDARKCDGPVNYLRGRCVQLHAQQLADHAGNRDHHRYSGREPLGVDGLSQSAPFSRRVLPAACCRDIDGSTHTAANHHDGRVCPALLCRDPDYEHGDRSDLTAGWLELAGEYAMSRISFLQDILGAVFARESAEALSASAGNGSFVELCDALLSERGEMSGNRIARGLLARFAEADEEGEREFFELLATRFDINAEHCVRAARMYADDATSAHLEVLVESVEPRRQELLRRINRVPGATHELVRMRERLFAHARKDPSLARIDVDFRHLFRSWFNRGFLVLREIDWHTPANILEKIIAYEAVHAIGSWGALRNRLQPSDRRCFAFFHPAMPDEPLIFVEVALTLSTPSSVREVLSSDRETIPGEAADSAVFYSISNCQKGLAGISFGNFLIKQVATELRTQLPGLTTFRTLSPIPGFMRWLEAIPETQAETPPDEIAGSVDPESIAAAQRLAAGEAQDPDEDSLALLEKLVARYLAREKREDGQPLDPVARFHLGNGASLDRVLANADRFDKGLKQSAGAMVSYLYDLNRVEVNHEAYASEREVIASDSVTALLAEPKRARKRA